MGGRGKSQSAPEGKPLAQWYAGLCRGHPRRSKTCSSGVFYFFFQAEDGIRDLYVTVVQTCALPIYISYLAWAYHQEVGCTECGWGHAAEVSPPLPWKDRDHVLRRDQEIQQLWGRKQTSPAPKAG